MKAIYALIMSLCAATGFGYDTLAPQYYGQVVVVHPAPVATQIMVYNTPYFTVTVPVPVTSPITVAQPVQQTYWWGYPYQPLVVNQYWHHNCRLPYFRY